MRAQSNATGVNSRGNYVDLQQYDQKLKPSPLVPRKQMKKESAMNQAFIRGFLDELEKRGFVGKLIGAGSKALKAQGGVRGLAGKGAKWFKGADPFTQMQVAQTGMEAVKGIGGAAVGGAKRLLGRSPAQMQAKAQDRAARMGLVGAQAKRPTGLMGGLGMGGAV